MAGSLLASRKMVMIPTFRWHKQASGLPIDSNKFASGRPHERITFARDHDDLSAWSMTMRFLVRAGFDGHDVADHGVAGKMNSQAAKADAPFRMGIQRNRVEVRNEIDDPIFLLPRLELTAKKVFLSGEAVGKFVRHIENEIRRIVDIHYQGQIVGRGDTNRDGRRTVVVLVLQIKRRCKKTA